MIDKHYSKRKPKFKTPPVIIPRSRISEKYYVKRGRKYEEVGEETPRFLSDGIWLVDKKTNSTQMIAKIGDIENTWKYGQMAAHAHHLPNFIRAKINEYFNDTFQCQADGSFRYCMPSAHDMAKDILMFLSMNEDERREAIKKTFRKVSHISSDGHVVDGNGDIIYNKVSKEKLAFEIKKLKEDLILRERLLEERLVAEL